MDHHHHHFNHHNHHQQIQELMEGPLVTWLRTFEAERPLTSQQKTLLIGEFGGFNYEQLADGMLLNQVMSLIDPQAPHSASHILDGDADDADATLVQVRNLDAVVRNVKAFYEDVLGQVVVVPLPDPLLLASGRGWKSWCAHACNLISAKSDSKEGPSTPSSATAVNGDANESATTADFKLLLLLLLGCAVQCHIKEQLIEKIKGLEVTVQHAIVNCIQKVTENPAMVWMPEWDDLTMVPEEQHESLYRVLVQHVRRLVRERDEFAQHVTQMLLHHQSNSHKSDGADGKSEKNHHQAVELADYKGKLRRLRQECEEKSETLSECREELEQVKQQLGKLRQENLELVQDARAAKAYRDELDILRERAGKADKLEAEIQRYRDRVNDIEFYRARVEELREDNRILVETKEMLEEQLEHSRRRGEHVIDLEAELLKLKQQLNTLMAERDSDRSKIHQLVEDNCELQLRTKNSLNESANLVAELDLLKGQSTVRSDIGFDSLSEQLGHDAQARILRLELENQRLQSAAESAREAAFRENSDRILELEKENKRLSQKVNHIQDSNKLETQKNVEIEQALELSRREQKRLGETLETVKTNSERQVEELQTEKQQLSELIETLRERQQKSTSARLSDIEVENRRLVETNLNLQSQVSRLGYEKQQLNKLNERLRESSEKLVEVEHLKSEYEQENEDLKRTISAFKQACDQHEKLEEEYASLEVENKRLGKYVENMKQTCTKLDTLGQDNVKLASENERLRRMVEVQKVSSEKLAALEHEKEELCEANRQLNTKLEASRTEVARLEEDKVALLAVTGENQKLQRSLEASASRLAEVEREAREVESENSKLRRTVESLRLSAKRLNEIEREAADLEAENHRLERESRSLTKEVARFRQAVEVKDAALDECTSRASTLERENKRLVKELEAASSVSARTKELEKENRDLVQSSLLDKKTLCTLREDLVAEKIRSQQAKNELEKVLAELQRIGVNRDGLSSAASQSCQEDGDKEDRFAALEKMMEEALKKGLEIKDEKISALESRLNESSIRNRELCDKLSSLRREHEALRQRMEENETDATEVNGEKSIPIESIKEFERVKERLVEIEAENLIILAENNNLKSQAHSLREQTSALHAQVTSLQNQATLLTQAAANLQSEHAKLQVESTALRSQNTALQSQISAVQTAHAQLESEKDCLVKERDGVSSAHSQLAGDQETLQVLHDQLSQEYEQLKRERDGLKTANRDLKNEYKLLREQYEEMNSRQEDVQKLRDILETETEHLRSDSKSLANLRAEHSRLKEDFRSLYTANDKLKSEYRGLQSDYKSLKTDNNQLILRQTEMQGELADNQEQIHVLDVEISKLTNKCEVLAQLNVTLEDDRRSLMSQVTLLLTQYHDLLTQTLDDKEHFHSEEKLFADRLNNLRRQKEKLEEKIMEQYKKMESSSAKKRGFGSTLVRRMRRAGSELMSKARTGRSRSRGRTDNTDNNTDSHDNSSLGSGSGGQESLDSCNDTRRSSPQDLYPPSVGTPDLSETRSVISAVSSAPSSRRVSRVDSFASNSAHRKSLPLFRGSVASATSIRESFSSEDIVSLKAESIEGNGEDDGSHGSRSTLTHYTSDKENESNLSSTLSLGSAGTRRAVYYTDDDDSIPTRDVGPDPLMNRVGRASIRSAPEVGHPTHSRTPSAGTPSQGCTCNCGNSSLSANIQCVVHVSTPITNKPDVDAQFTRHGSLPHWSGVNGNTTPNRPSPAGMRPLSSTPILSSQSPKHAPQPPPKPNRAPAPDPSGVDKPREVDNSVWYEYGCV